MLRRFSILPIDLRRIDTLNVDAIVLPLFNEVMQPQGVAGYYDWRLCGRLARLISSAQFSGVANETMLLSYADRVGPTQLFLYGLGEPKQRSADQCYAEFHRILQILRNSRAKTVALSVPQPFAVETFCHWIQTPSLASTSLEELLIMDSDEVFDKAKKKIRPLLKKLGLEDLSRPSTARVQSQASPNKLPSGPKPRTKGKKSRKSSGKTSN